MDFIKRLIGKPGDTIQVKGAQILIDGEPVEPQSLGSYDVHAYVRERLGLIPDAAVKLYPDYVLVEGKKKYDTKELATVLGHEGAKIQIVPGQTLRNGKVLDEPYTREDPDYNYPEDTSEPPVKLGDDELFMMGDNRNHSKDSHIWGPLKRKNVVGHAVVLFWPPNRMGLIR
ncbi:MAG: signal peptidase I [Alphaproteobacteria bacterium]|nr:MAG: signal peptidase I [Alphaproteobacteria bacterium]